MDKGQNHHGAHHGEGENYSYCLTVTHHSVDWLRPLSKACILQSVLVTIYISYSRPRRHNAAYCVRWRHSVDDVSLANLYHCGRRCVTQDDKAHGILGNVFAVKIRRSSIPMHMRSCACERKKMLRRHIIARSRSVLYKNCLPSHRS